MRGSAKQKAKFKRAQAICRRKCKPFTKAFGACMRKALQGK